MDVHRPLHRDKAFVQAVMCTLDIEAEIGKKTVLAAKRYLVHEQISIIYVVFRYIWFDYLISVCIYNLARIVPSYV